MNPGYLAWRAAETLINSLPAALTDRLAYGVGVGIYYLWFSRRQVARDNFARVLALPVEDPRVGQTARRAFANYTVYILNMMRYGRVTRDEFRQHVHLNIPPSVQAVLAENRPVIVVSAHYGNMDYAAPVAAEQYRRFTLAAETIKPVEVFEHLAALRSANGVDLIPYDRAPRKILEAIKRKEIVGFLIDFGINAHKDINTVPVRFFGEMTDFPSSPAVLAQKYDAPLVVAFARIGRDGDIYVDVDPPLRVSGDLPRAQAQHETMQLVADHFEKAIRTHPEQWYVFRPMWPGRPRRSGRLLRRLRAALSS